MNRTWIAAAVALAAGLAVSAGCANTDPTRGDTTASQYRTDVKTIAVPILRRGTGEYRRGIEIRLTEAIVKRIETDTPYKVVDRARPDCDSVLTGTLNWVKLHLMSIDTRYGKPREIQARLSIDFTWKSLRGPGEVFVERENFRVAAVYIGSGRFSEDFFVGSEDAINKAAQRIVEQLARPW